MAKKRRRRNRKQPARINPSDAVAIVDDMDLPDGAYMAMLEEMTGMDPVDAILAGTDPKDIHYYDED